MTPTLPGVSERALLVGSVPISGPEEVFRTTVAVLGDRIKRLPDGETGDRSNWIGWQIAFMQQPPQLELVPPPSDAYAPLPSLKLRSGASASEVVFEDLGYAAAARASYAIFERLQNEGVIQPSMRFQVSLPTPLAPVVGFVAPEDQAALEPRYEARLLEELDEICAAIPHDRLAIQWDTAIEFAIIEGVWPSFLTGRPEVEREIVDRLVRIGQRVPADVELGYHLCYGDAGHRHFKEPDDTRHLVSVANAISERLERPMAWLHLPVPRERSDEGYFAPLRDLRLHPETELYLGVVHLTDGVEGTRRRMTAARTYAPTFGVATECGLGRRPPETIKDVLQLHVDAVADANVGSATG